MVGHAMATTPDRRPPRRPPTHEIRAAIVDATVRLIGRGGTAAVTHRAVAAEAGVSLSSTTYHFSSKDEIVDAALLRVAEREIARLEDAARALRDRGDVAEVIRATADWLAAQLAEDDDTVRAGYHLQLEAAQRPALRDIHRAWGVAVHRLAEGVLAAAGSRRPGLDARLVAAAIDGLRLEALTTPGVSSARPAIERLLLALTGR